MSVTYNLHVDRDYYRTLIERYYQQRPLMFRLYVQFGLLALFAATFIVFGFDASLGTLIVVAVVVAAAIVFGGVGITRWGIFQRYRYRADFGSEATIVMSANGLVANGLHVEGKWAWGAYPNAVRFHDGLMLLRPGVIRWLPDSAILVGTPEDATALVRSNSALRELA